MVFSCVIPSLIGFDREKSLVLKLDPLFQANTAYTCTAFEHCNRNAAIDTLYITIVRFLAAANAVMLI